MTDARPLLRAAAIVAALSASACAGGSGFLREAGLEGTAPKGPEAPDFVTSSRTATGGEFLPIGVDAPRRPIRARSKESQESLQAELERARTSNADRGRAAESAGRSVGKGHGAPASSPPPSPEAVPGE